MNLAQELQELQALHDAGTLTDEEFVRAKAAALAAAESPEQTDVALLKQQMEQVRLQSEIDRVDHAWETERQKWMGRGRYGAHYVPTREGTVAGAVSIACISLVPFGFACVVPFPSTIPLLFVGILSVVTGIAVGIGGNRSVDRYEQAYYVYQNRRAELVAQKEHLTH